MKNILNIKTPSNIYLWWNFGFSISIIIIIQFITGFIISINYITKPEIFESSFNIFFNINYGWFIRIIHRNTTSILFILIIIHITRRIIYKSIFLIKIWIRGIIMLIILIIESFLGYSLIWNQISYWAIIVITNFIRAIPIIGIKMVLIIWGNFNINIILINRFLSIHFIIPIIINILIIIHILILHSNKSSNPMGTINKIDIICLNPLSIYKDIILILIIIILLLNLNLFKPTIILNSDSFIKINYFNTPSHIEPEWYFLLFYSILRSINNKLRGLIIVIIILLLFIIIPLININNIQSIDTLNKILSIKLISIIFFISIIRKNPVETPFLEINKVMIIYTFLLLIIYKFKSKIKCYKINLIWN